MQPGPVPQENRPLLLLDVDGVLNVLRFSLDAIPSPRFYGCATRQGYPIVYKWATAGRLERLAKVFEIHWATTWGEAANVDIGPLVGLPPLPVCPVGRYDFGPFETWKLPRVQAYVGERPCAWIDDDLHRDAESWACQRALNIPTLLVRTDPSKGISRQNEATLLRFSQSVRAWQAGQSAAPGEASA